MRARIATTAFASVLVLLGEHGARAQATFEMETPEEVRESFRKEEAPAARVPPYEPPYARFGSPGQFVITNELALDLSSTSYAVNQNSVLSGSVEAGLDYFLVRNLSIGASVDVDYSKDLGYGANNSLVRTTTWWSSGGPRVGYNIPLGQSFSLYPTATLGLEWTHEAVQVVSGTSATIAGVPTGASNVTQTGPYALLYVPLLYHPRPHFFVGFGPSIFRDFGKAQGGPDVGAERTRAGAGLEVGGYFGGTPVAEAASPSQTATGEAGPRGPARRFGERGVFVITGEVGAGAFWTGYDGTPASSTSVSFSPGIDYFILNHVSLGLAVSGSYSSTTGLDGTVVVTNTSTTFSVAPRIGVEIPLGRSFSLYPRGSAYFGYAIENEDDATNANDSKQVYAGLELSVPLLLHVAPHLFVGLGPSVSHDLTHSIQYAEGGYQDGQTTVGASFVVGGWL